jgi:hypothetical protein
LINNQKPYSRLFIWNYLVRGMEATVNFLDALTFNDTFTENAMPTHSTSGSYLVDMFFKMGGSRNLSIDNLRWMLDRALAEDRLLATKAVFYNRDVRGGQGERRSFRAFFHYLAHNYPEVALANIENVPYYGRWDDLLVALDSPIEEEVLGYIYMALANGDKLCAKWMPRENKKNVNIAKRLAKSFGLSRRDYRRLLAGNTSVVENLMCKNQWRKINYEHVPSKAMNRYRNAFQRHDPDGFASFLTAVESGEKEIKAGAIFPHDIIKPYFYSNALDRTIEAQWKAQPDYMPKGYRIMPVCDVSGSMGGLPMEVCVALGIYLAERNEGPYHNHFITFSSQPKLQKLIGGSIKQRVNGLINAHWQLNTNLEAVFRLILNKAVENDVPANQLPSTILILSDMQFDRCVQNPDNNAMQMIRRMYTESGYELPNVVFWNLRTSSGIPVKYNEGGVALVSGFSPSILRNIFNGELEPMKVVLRTLTSNRYDRVL